MNDGSIDGFSDPVVKSEPSTALRRWNLVMGRGGFSMQVLDALRDILC
jgi:hypothetical protein